MSDSFLAACHRRVTDLRRLDAPPGRIQVADDDDGLVYAFELEDGQGEEWADVWVNSFECYGAADARCLPPPPLQASWHPCDHTLDHGLGPLDDHLRAVLDEDVERVRELFTTPADLLRWRCGTFMCGLVVGFTYYESTVHLAFCTLHLAILQHLFSTSPMHFMQLMGMTNTEEYMGEGGALPLLMALSLPVPVTAAEERRAQRLPAVLTWLCESGLMTPTLAQRCFPKEEHMTAADWQQLSPKAVRQEMPRRWVIEAEFARRHLEDAGALPILERWEQLPLLQQRVLTQATFATDLMRATARMPWEVERVLWLGARSPGAHALCNEDFSMTLPPYAHPAFAQCR